MKVCRHCAAQFNPAGRRQIFCTAACRLEAWRTSGGERACDERSKAKRREAYQFTRPRCRNCHEIFDAQWGPLCRACLSSAVTASGKTCKACKVLKPASEYNGMRKSTDGLQHTCKACATARKIARRATSAGKEAMLKYARSRKEIRVAQTRRWRDQNPDKSRESSRKQVNDLRGAYIAHAMGLPIAAVPKDLIEAKRTSLRIVRLLKEKNE